jgi:hypothetical protein
LNKWLEYDGDDDEYAVDAKENIKQVLYNYRKIPIEFVKSQDKKEKSLKYRGKTCNE